MLISTADKKLPKEVNSNIICSAKMHVPGSETTRLQDRGAERSLNRRLGIRDLPMPPMPSDADDDIDDDEADGISAQDLRKTEDYLCDSIVKSYVKSKHSSPAETCPPPLQQYVLTMIILFLVCDIVLNLIMSFLYNIQTM